MVNAGGNQGSPDVTYDGSRFVVVWVDDRNGTATDIYGAFVSTSGAVQPSGGLVLAKSTSTDITPRISWGKTPGRSLVVYGSTATGSTSDRGIRGCLLDKSKVLTPGGFSIANPTRNQSAPHAAPLGGGFLVVWEDDTTLSSKDDIKGARVNF